MLFKMYNGTLIPAPGFGTYRADDDHTCASVVKCALEAGYRHIDTAASYDTETAVGQGLRECAVASSQVFVTSKVKNSERGYDSTLRAFDTTLAKLGLDYLDLYLIHWPANVKQYGDKAEAVNADTWRALERLYREGRVKAIGLSNFMPHHIEALLKTATVMPMVDQIEFHPGLLQPECVDYCHDKGIVVEAWSALGRGATLTHAGLNAIAARHGKTAAQVVLRWVMQHGVLPLVKSVHAARIRENFGIFDFELSVQDMRVIDGLQAPRIGADPDERDF